MDAERKTAGDCSSSQDLREQWQDALDLERQRRALSFASLVWIVGFYAIAGAAVVGVVVLVWRSF